MKQEYHRISVRDDSGLWQDVATIRSDSSESAASVYARRQYGRRATAIRVTGLPGKTGIFQAFVPVRTGGQTSQGPQFHVF